MAKGILQRTGLEFIDDAILKLQEDIASKRKMIKHEEERVGFWFLGRSCRLGNKQPRRGCLFFMYIWSKIEKKCPGEDFWQ